jgi:phosphotransferase system enzyme I (PtsI)
MRCLRLIADARRQMRRDGLPFDPLMPIGGMIEVPAAALMAGALAKRLDFLSIGTNDLIQYTLAIDRVDDTVSYLYDPLHPSVLRLDQARHRRGAATRTSVGMCGEMAGDARFTRCCSGSGCASSACSRWLGCCEVKDDLENIPSQELLARLQP